MGMKQYVSDYIHIYEELREKLKWKIVDKRILMTIASLYVMKSKEFQFERFLQIQDELKKQSSMFSPMRSHLSYTTAAMLHISFENAVDYIPSFYSLYEDFVQAKFRRGNFTYIAASVLLTKQPAEDTSSKEIIAKAKDIYDGMRKEHPFLTSASDYPLATLIAFENREGIIEHIENFYIQLSHHGFRKGNDLQFLSHILSLHNDETVEVLINRITLIYDSFKKHDIRAKSSYYPIMGMLALLPNGDVNMDVITRTYEQLNSEKQFKWQKDMNIIVSVCFYVSQELEYDGLAETSIYTTMEAILQAQQAVMIATIAGATVVSTSNSSSQ